MLRLLTFLALIFVTLSLPSVYTIIMALIMTLPVTLATLAYLVAVVRVDRAEVPQIISALTRCLLKEPKLPS